MANPAVIVDFVANTRDLQTGLVGAQRSASKFGSKIKGLALAGAAAGFAALTATVKTGVAEYAEASKVGAQTNAVLKSTGKAAHVSADQVSTLATSLMKKSGVDDEAIQSGENLLLTFTNIRNEAGKGNDVFNQTTKAALDMSVALGTDMKSASLQLGKALNDPVKGMTKLQRSGVTFTDAQKKQVAALEKSGKTLEAQKIILAEVNKEFGGSAEAAGKTLPGQLNILKETFNNLAGEMIAKMIPTLTAVAKLLIEHKNVVIAVVAVVAGLTGVVLAVTAATAAWNAAQALARAASVAWAAAQWLVNAALTANPIGIVIVAIGALVAAIVIAYKTSDKFRAIVNAAFQAVLNAAKALWNWLKQNWPLLLGILTGPIGAAIVLIARNWDTIRDKTKAAFNAIRDTVTSVANSIKSGLAALASWIGGALKTAISSAAHGVGAVFDFIADGARDAYESVKRNLNGLVSFIEGIVGSVGRAASSVAHALKAPINAVISAWNALGIPRVQFSTPAIKIKGHTIVPSKTIGFGPFNFPDIRQLAKGGIVTQPTLALIGEAGPEAVVPLNQAAGFGDIQVRVFIGDTELKGLVRTEIVDANTGLARTLLAGGT